MLIEEKSKYLLKRVRAKAKMNEYHIPSHLHGEMDSDAKYLLILAVATIGDFSNDIVDMYNGNDCDYVKHKTNLQFASRFFDAYLDSEMYEGGQEYFLLLGASVYYLCDYNGSSRVLADKIPDDIDMGVNELDSVLAQILKGNENINCSSKYEIIKEVVAAYNRFLKAGTDFEFEKLVELKHYLYHIGSDREILLSDVLIATIYLKVHQSSFRLMPIYTQVESSIWNHIIKKGTIIKELWQSQRQLGEAGVFAGKSATIQMPTSSGKTKSVALIILSSFLQNKSNNAIVVAPFRSLCREITDELYKAFSFTDKIHVNEISDVMQMDFISILLGKEEESEEKYVYVVTPEKLLFILRQEIIFLSNVGLIIFDEGHLFDDMSRGITYELLLSTIKHYMKEKMQKILISAVIPNADQVNEWFTDGSGVVIKNNIIQTTEKVVGITDIKISKKKDKYAYLFFINPENPDEEEFFVPRVIGQTPLKLRKRETKERVFPEINNKDYRNDMAITYGINLCINGGVAIFCGKKETADKILNRILEIKDRGYDITNLVNSSDTLEISKITYLIKEEMGEDSDYYKAACVGAFVHHGGIPIGIRSSVEFAMQVGKIKFLACTSTLAQGVNLPIRYLIISNIYQGRERIRVRDFQNLIGRAGRAGIYTEGTILLSETGVYNRRKDPNYNWRWNNYKQLLSSDKAEACTSALFAWLRADKGMEEYLESVIEIFIASYANGDFVANVKDYLEKQKFDKEENYEKAEFILHQMIKNIEAIESFLLFYLLDNTYEESKQEIHDIIKETLAYYLAEEKERERLLRIVDLIGEFLVYTVDTPEKRCRYSKSLLGIRKEIEIEGWVHSNLKALQDCITESDLVSVIFPLLLETNSSIVSKYKNKDLLCDIVLEWIEGKSYHDIKQMCLDKEIRLHKRGKARTMTLQDVINFCDNFLGYDCTLILAAVIENVDYYCENDSSLNQNLKMLSKRMRYGLLNQTSILLYEMGLNDRKVAMTISQLLDAEYKAGSRKEIINLVKNNTELQRDVENALEKYPTYFLTKWKEVIYSC